MWQLFDIVATRRAGGSPEDILRRTRLLNAVFRAIDAVIRDSAAENWRGSAPLWNALLSGHYIRELVNTEAPSISSDMGPPRFTLNSAFIRRLIHASFPSTSRGLLAHVYRSLGFLTGFQSRNFLNFSANSVYRAANVGTDVMRGLMVRALDRAYVLHSAGSPPYPLGSTANIVYRMSELDPATFAATAWYSRNWAIGLLHTKASGSGGRTWLELLQDAAMREAEVQWLPVQLAAAAGPRPDKRGPDDQGGSTGVRSGPWAQVPSKHRQALQTGQKDIPATTGLKATAVGIQAAGAALLAGLTLLG